jgi:CelD/BcsL family acetyltransferase involved in cellulose biosynthesis
MHSDRSVRPDPHLPPSENHVAPASLTSARVETFEGLVALEREWTELAFATRDRLPFGTWDWAVSWWECFAEKRRGVSDRLWTVTFRDGTGRLVALAPLMLTERPAIGPLRARSLQFIGPGRPNELRSLIALPEWEDGAHHALAGYLEAHASEWDWMLWSGLREGGTAAARLAQKPLGQRLDSVPDFVLPIAGAWPEFRSRLPRNVKESLRKCYNSLKRAGIEFAFEAVASPEEVPPAVEEFFALHRARAHLHGTVAHKDLFDDERTRRFLRLATSRLAGRSATRVFRIRVGGRTVACRIGFRIGDALYLYFSGYDPAFRQYSIMTTVVAEALQHAFATGVRSVNLSTGEDVSKTRWRPVEQRFQEMLQISPAANAGRFHAAYQGIRRIARATPLLRDIVARLIFRSHW